MLTILYRGPLSSCNYGCHYCPFAKRKESRAELAVDAAALCRFVDWVAHRGGAAGEFISSRVAVFFTPWGEALIRAPYREALIALTHMDHVARAAIQTNLSAPLGWIERCQVSRLGVWATYHPGWADRGEFVARVRSLHERGVSVSAGVVGFKHLGDEIAALRRELPEDVYLWINAYKRDPGYYQPGDIARLERIDPLFRINTRRHPGRACRAGHTVISVDGQGTARRCHFIAEPIGNIYDPGFDAALRPRPCSNDTCGCHIGYVHLDHLGLGEVFGEGILERVPARPLWQPRGKP